MQIGYISFCDKTAFNIKTQYVKEQILKDIYNISQIKIIQKHFEILKEHHFKKLNDNPHLISLKSNGNPYLLYLTKYNFVNTCIFIDKKVQAGYFLPRMIISRFNFPDELFDNTLLEGEMIKDNNKKWIFLINDLYIYTHNTATYTHIPHTHSHYNIPMRHNYIVTYIIHTKDATDAFVQLLVFSFLSCCCCCCYYGYSLCCVMVVVCVSAFSRT